jgi:hypothetical protein
MMTKIDGVVSEIRDEGRQAPRPRAILVGVSGIDGAAKGHVTARMVARL